MKRLFLLSMMLLVLIAPSSAQKTYALICGVSKYSDPTGGCIDLKHPAKGAKTMKKIYSEIGAVPVLLTSKYVTQENVLDKLNSIVKIAKPEDKIIFHFIGHGSAGNIYFYQGKAFPYTTLIQTLGKARTNNILCVIDACHSGSAIQTASADYPDLKGAQPVFLMACRANESTGENGALASPIFTLALAKGIRGRADANSDRKVSIMELFKYVHSDVSSRGKSMGWQVHPQLLGNSKQFETVISELR